jgi:uncharacterized protein (TIGR04255 family)
VPQLPRCWFISADKTQVIQVQPERFLRNWRRVEGGEVYPRFRGLARAFRQDWERFSSFVNEENLGPLNVNQCELSYINMIEREAGWNELGKLDEVFPGLLRPRNPHGFLPTPESLSWQARYKFPDGRGRLHVVLEPVFRGRDLKLVVSLNLTARGAPAGGSVEQIFAWFDLAHEWIVRGFAELTGPKAHALWGAKSSRGEQP